MIYQLSWIVPKRVILVEYVGNAVLTDEEALACDQEVSAMIDSGDGDAALIHQIVVFGDMMMPPKLKTMTLMQSPKNPRNGWVIAVGGKNPLLGMMGNLAAQTFQMRSRRMNTVEGALEFLYDVDATIPRQTPDKTNA